MSPLELKIKRLPESDAGGPQRLSIAVAGLALTRVLRPGETALDDAALVPPEPLAFWLVDNWWRLRWESVPAAGFEGEWRLAHDLAAIGGGYAWPRLTIWGEGDRVGLLSSGDPVGVVGPVRYLEAEPPLHHVSGAAFEAGIDRFLAEVVDEKAGFGSDRAALRAQIDELREERADRDTAAWRRLEARLGYDPDEAPDGLMEQLAGLARAFGANGVEEAATAAPGADAGKTLEREIAAAKASRIVCTFDEAAKLARPAPAAWRGSPWVKAERAAAHLRRKTATAPGPLHNKALAEIIRTRPSALAAVPAPEALPYGLRLKSGDDGKTRVALRPRRSSDRRFELVRALGDVIWAGGDRIGPLAASRTDRQKFQRAFAQSLLCPYEDLIAFLDTDAPTDGDLSAAAQHFHVSERVIRTVLVNKHDIGRDRLAPASWQASDRIDALMELT